VRSPRPQPRLQCKVQPNTRVPTIGRAIPDVHTQDAAHTVAAITREIVAHSPSIYANQMTPFKQKGSLAAPLSLICCVVSEATRTARVFSGDAHRKSGVFSVRATLSPVESCSLLSF
jgi:hypothetical protein